MKEESTVPAGDYLEMSKMLHEERVSVAEDTESLHPGTGWSGPSIAADAGIASGVARVQI